MVSIPSFQHGIECSIREPYSCLCFWKIALQERKAMDQEIAQAFPLLIQEMKKKKRSATNKNELPLPSEFFISSDNFMEQTISPDEENLNSNR